MPGHTNTHTVTQRITGWPNLWITGQTSTGTGPCLRTGTAKHRPVVPRQGKSRCVLRAHATVAAVVAPSWSSADTGPG